MRRFKGLLFICALALFLAGCSFAGSGGSGTKSVPPDSAILSVSAEPEAAGEPEEPAPSGRPSKEEVLAAREKALEGMSQGQIDRLREVVIAANLKLENGYLNDGLFERLEDPDSLAWNYFDQAGEIQTGWAYDGDLDMEAVCAAENLTEDAFYAKYGRGISETNDYTADDFISLMEELAETVDSEDLKADLQYMADEMERAKSHAAGHVRNVYETLHDLDYFLLRYGPEDFGLYGMDRSTVSLYYGTLSLYG